MTKYVRYQNQATIGYGELDGGPIYPLDRNFLEQGFKRTGEPVPAASVRLLAPVVPPNILAIGLNYREHSRETNMPPSENPQIFLKATTSLTGPECDIVLPRMAPGEVDYEAELAVVIGKTARNVSAEEAPEYVFGYTCANDVSARDCQLRTDRQWARGKSFDTFCPAGPWAVRIPDASDLRIQSRLNGKTMQDSNTSELISGVNELVSYCSRNMTLLPGTLILTGTPSGVGYMQTPPMFLKNGDIVEIEIEQIGVLRNTVTMEP
jgi:2-keto-4-pentenoate hydratase/2-oxohepta-3-ene-1,7-dioic acid hydratase in catechol pathway